MLIVVNHCSVWCQITAHIVQCFNYQFYELEVLCRVGVLHLIRADLQQSMVSLLLGDVQKFCVFTINILTQKIRNKRSNGFIDHVLFAHANI